MKRTPRYTDEKLGRVEVVEDFLPPPEQLVLKLPSHSASAVSIFLRRTPHDRAFHIRR